MGKWQLGTLAAFLIIYSLLVLITGNPVWLVPIAGFAILCLGYAGLNMWISRRALRAHDGDREEAMADEDDPIPATHIIPDDDRPSGDTPEVHAEVNPHDFPLDSPARHTVAAQVGGANAETRGNAEGGAGGDFEGPVEDRTDQRAVEGEKQQRSATSGRSA